jgi:hypothetical protein
MKTISPALVRKAPIRTAWFVALLATTGLTAVPAHAEDTSRLSKKIDALEQQLRELRSELAATQASATEAKSAVAEETAVREKKEADQKKEILDHGGHLIFVDGKSEAVPPEPPKGGVTNKNIKITFGGFIEAAGILRNKNESADVGSSFNSGAFFPNNPQGHISEFRGTARQSRLSILAQGDVDKYTHLAAYYEMDFLGAAPTANSNESNSYNPRIRNIYATVDRDDMGLHILAGQSWSLLTLNKQGIMPRTEVAPIGIEAQYVVGFNWTRNPQVRIVKDFDKKLWVGISAESPAAQISGTTPAGTIVNNPGSGQLGNGTPASNFAIDPAPDVIAKVAYDPGFGHYELFGITRWFRSRAALTNNTINAWGGGGSALVPVIPKMLDIQASFMIGNGMGRYGSGQLPDVTIDNVGHLHTLPYVSALVGVVGHPDPLWDIYAYGGTEQLKKRYYTAGASQFGYGNPFSINNTGCFVEGGTCNGQTAKQYEITGGFWYRFYKGNWGYLQAGIQDEYVRRTLFAGNTSGGASAGINIAMFSFRYYPF